MLGMEHRVLGRTSTKVSPLCLGTDAFDDPTPEKECAKMLNSAIAAGINLIDTGDAYAERARRAYHRSDAEGERASPVGIAFDEV